MPDRKEVNQSEQYLSEDSDSEFLQKYFQDASKQELLEAFITFIKNNGNDLDDTQINQLLNDVVTDIETLIPINVFDNDSLSALEAIVKYLKEERRLNYHEIGELLNRDDRTIWSTYARAKKKMLDEFSLTPSKHHIPARLFAERTLSVLETLAWYLHDTLGLQYAEVARLLNRDDRTIWTVCYRAKKKLTEGER